VQYYPEAGWQAIGQSAPCRLQVCREALNPEKLTALICINDRAVPGAHPFAMGQFHIGHGDQGRDRISDTIDTASVEGKGLTGAAMFWQEIEAEHAAIIELLSRARVIAAQSRLSTRAVVGAYEAVVRKFEDHFANEERLMAEAEFPDADASAHHRHHQVLLIRLFSICERMKTQRSVETGQLHLIFQSLLDDAIGADASLREHLERVPGRNE
jgi:hemerythrin